MNNGAKRFLSAVPVIWLTMMSPSAMHAQSYPNQDIHFICAFPAGSGADVLVRYFAEKVRPLADRAILVENKVGNVGMIAGGIYCTLQAGWLHHLRPRSEHHCGQHVVAQEATD